MRFDNCFCINSICTPSRAVILVGTHNHVNRVTTLYEDKDIPEPETFDDNYSDRAGSAALAEMRIERDVDARKRLHCRQ